jgi:filamentous hemagglutinin family protein
MSDSRTATVEHPVKSSGLHHTCRLAWSRVHPAFIAVADFALARGKQIVSFAAVATVILTSGGSGAADLPIGGNIVAGSGRIAQSGKTMTVTQSTNRMAADWQSFNIGAGNTVNFVQPSAGAVALNRVLGADVSVIQGTLKANGQVFLVNPNGVLFSPTAQVNVGGLVASTLNITKDDFMAGNYRFMGNSAQSVRNEGTLKVGAGGTVALIAARVENLGSIAAPQGNVLLGAGQKVRLDLGGPVKLEVEAGALNALIEQGGAIRADGGRIHLTAKAAGDLASSVINNTGVIEAHTLVTGEKGQIMLMGDMQVGTVNVSGTLDAGAPHGGDGGFIETSAAKVRTSETARVTTAAMASRTGTWLIDPHDYTIAASGGDISGTQLGTNLNSNNVTIQSSDGASGTNGDIFVNDAVTWATANTLTLNAWRNININANISASQGTLKLYYGQGALNNSDTAVNPSRIYIGSGATINLSAGKHYYTKLGSDGEETAWTVITALGNEGSLNDGTLQGINGVFDDWGTIAGNYVLGADIDATATQTWNGGQGFTPLGLTNLSNVFTGRFDGLGHTIDKLYINRPGEWFVGFFGISDPTNGSTYVWSGSPIDTPQIANFRLTNLNVVGGGTVGGVDGENRNSSISNVYASGTVSSTGGRVGGLVGNNKYGLVLNSYSTVNVTGSSGTGGLVGEFEGEAYITNSYASGTVSSCSWACGGLIGSMGEGIVTKSYYNTSVNTDASMEDKTSYGLSAGNLTAAAKTNWSGSIWDTSGALPSLKQFIAIPIYGNPVAGGTSNPDDNVPATTYVTYTLASLAGYQYQGTAYQLSDLWSSSSIFGSSYAGWAANTDYSFMYNGSAVTGFTNAGTYSNIGINILKSGYALAGSGNSPGTLTINPRPITVTADAKSKIYGNANPTLTYQVTASSLVNSDSLSGALSRTAGENVGNYTINTSALANSNYLITANNGTLTIDPRPITVTADTKTKTYGSADPTLTYQVTAGSLVNSDSLSGALGRTAGENVGNYTINTSALANSNYLITANNGTLTIDPRPITVTADAKTKTYGSADPTLTITDNPAIIMTQRSVAGIISGSSAAGTGSPLMSSTTGSSLTGGADGRGQNNTTNLGNSAGFVRADGLSASGGLTFVEVSSLPGQGTAGAGKTGNTGGMGSAGTQVAGVDPHGFIRVLVVNGGINRGGNPINQQ